MTRYADNGIWVIDEGDRVIQKKAHAGLENLTTWERLVYCLWAADYGMRNAGDLGTSKDVYADFQSTARRAAEALSLPLTRDTFSMEPTDLEDNYLARFDAIVDEIRSAKPGAADER
jgi:hypothetical protein